MPLKNPHLLAREWGTNDSHSQQPHVARRELPVLPGAPWLPLFAGAVL